jgi:hypothetical protein
LVAGFDKLELDPQVGVQHQSLLEPPRGHRALPALHLADELLLDTQGVRELSLR